MPVLPSRRAVRAALISAPGVVAHVPAERIRAGIARPGDVPVIILQPAHVDVLGRAAGVQVVTEVRLMLHVWTGADQVDIAQQIVSAAMVALMDAPAVRECAIQGWERPVMTWARDPDPALSFAHGVISLRAVVYWRADQ